MPLPMTLMSCSTNVARIKHKLSTYFLPANRLCSHLESPQVTPGGLVAATSPLVVRGWVIPPVGNEVRAVEVRIDGHLAGRTSARGYRPRVTRAFPRREGLRRGFGTEVVLDRWMDCTVEMTVVVDHGENRYVLAQMPLKVQGRVSEESRRERSFRLDDLLACPDCHTGELALGPEQVRCTTCGAAFEMRRGTPLFATLDDPITSRLLETNFTHPYSEDAIELIARCSGGVVLDFGAGHPHSAQLHPHVLLHEAVHYNQIDVVSLTPRLPYRDNSFDAILSQAVFEHIPRPWEMASELYRILKPGGEIHVDTAFMQPFHSDPNHFFNMSIPGIREIFRPFREVRVGVKPYQLPSFGLRMQLEVMLEHMDSGPWRDRIQAHSKELQGDGCSVDAALDFEGRQNLAAGVYFHGVKPVQFAKVIPARAPTV
jgi:SAM-dependent methyltransferase